MKTTQPPFNYSTVPSSYHTSTGKVVCSTPYNSYDGHSNSQSHIDSNQPYKPQKEFNYFSPVQYSSVSNQQQTLHLHYITQETFNATSGNDTVKNSVLINQKPPILPQLLSIAPSGSENLFRNPLKAYPAASLSHPFNSQLILNSNPSGSSTSLQKYQNAGDSLVKTCFNPCNQDMNQQTAVLRQTLGIPHPENKLNLFVKKEKDGDIKVLTDNSTFRKREQDVQDNSQLSTLGAIPKVCTNSNVVLSPDDDDDFIYMSDDVYDSTINVPDFCSESVNFKVPLFVENNLKTLIRCHEDGVWCSKVPTIYQ